MVGTLDPNTQVWEFSFGVNLTMGAPFCETPHTMYTPYMYTYVVVNMINSRYFQLGVCIVFANL